MSEKLGIFATWKRINSEQEQALLRVFFATLIFVHLLSVFKTPQASLSESTVLVFSGIWLLFGVVFSVITFTHPKLSEKRQLLTIVADTSAVTFGMMMTEETGALFYGIYLWVIVGNGLRYGTRALIRTYILSVLGLSVVIYTNNYWQIHSTLSAGLMLTLLLIPLYIHSLLERLKKAITRAEEASQAKSKFLAHMSHEMRTPLNGVIGASELMLDTSLNSEQKDLLRTLNNSGYALLKLVENVLDFSKIESGKLAVERVDFDLHSIISSTLDMFSFQAKNKGIKLIKRFSPDVSYLLSGDAQHLRQVIINLVGNAIKFTSVGSVEVRVTTLVQHTTTTRLKFEVIDTGIGIPMEAQHTIFDSFTQAHVGTGNYGGTGLGTAISKQLIEFMGGEIGVSSVPEKGSTFWFELLFEKQPTHFPIYNFSALSQIHVLAIGIFQTEQNTLVDALSLWGAQFTHTASVAELFMLIEQCHASGQKNLCIMCRPQVINVSAQEFSSLVQSKYPDNQISLILIASNPNEYNLSELFNWGYSSQLKIPIEKVLLFNSLHALLTNTDISGNIIPFIEHYEQKTQRNYQGNYQGNILIAEDNSTNRKIISKILATALYNVEVAENGEQALDMLESKNYDLAILDMQMPVMSGLEAIRIYRASYLKGTRMPVIILTANATLDAQKECEEAGIDAFLTKPINSTVLLKTITQLIKQENSPSPFGGAVCHTEVLQLLNEDALHQLNLLATGDSVFVETVCQGFFLEGEKMLQAMDRALKQEQYTSFRELAHSMKGSAGNVGADALSQICTKILQLSHADLLSFSAKLLIEAQSCFVETKREISHHIKHMGTTYN